MTYNYEVLDDERFQKLAQSVLVHSFPNAQCLPVGQPDGGRDAFEGCKTKGDLIVFQVKFSRDPSSKIERDAITDVINFEAEKVRRLKQQGLKAYYLITNVRGSSHLDVVT